MARLWILCALTTIAVGAETGEPAVTTAPQEQPTATDADAPRFVEAPKPVNSICPVKGEAVDREVDVVVIDVVRDGAVVHVPVGVCCDRCLRQLHDDPQGYAAAALANRKAP